MKKHFSLRSIVLSLLAISLLATVVIITTSSSKASPTLADKLSGRILIQVEDYGSVWYVSPDNNNQRIQLRSPLEIFCFMKTLGLGISNNDLNKYLDNKFPIRLAGKILLAVEQHGEAYYINPLTLQGHYLGRPQEALKLMKGLALGISNTNLNTIEIFDTTKILEDCHIIIKPNDQEISKIKEKVDSIITNISLVTQEVEPMIDFSHIVSISTTIDNPNNLVIKEKGLLYDYTFLSDNNLTPTLDEYNKKIISSTESNDNTYTLDITNLTPGSYPFIRAYLITEDDQIIYGNTITIVGARSSYLPNLPIPSSSISTPVSPVAPSPPVWTTCGDIFYDDRDGNTYNTVEIGDQCWFKENLRYLPMVHSNSEYKASSSAKLPAYGVYGYDGSDITIAKNLFNYSTYGVLYNWYAAMQGMTAEGVQGACPAGWHIPKKAEWTALTDCLGGVDEAGGKIKAIDYWNDPNTGAINSSGFTAFSAGDRSLHGEFRVFGETTFFWSSLTAPPASWGNSWSQVLRFSDSKFFSSRANRSNGFSVRCLKDFE